MSKDNGGPAFPVNYSNERDGPTIMPAEGMTLRDYFAAKAMAAIIQTWPHVETVVDSEDELLNLTASDAYRFADAMLEERQQ